MSEDNSRASFERGCALQAAGKCSEAIQAFSEAIESDTASAVAYFRRGVCHYKLGRYDLARRDLDAASLLGYADAQLWSRFDSGGSKDCSEKGRRRDG